MDTITTKVNIRGVGYISKGEYGAVSKKLTGNCSNVEELYSHLLDDAIVGYPIKSFGRLDATSKMACCGVALALYDADKPYSKEAKQDIGLLGSNAEGALSANIKYFKDYVENGRSLARGNLFIYTLPTSPLAEVAIHFGCQGPLLYINTPEGKVVDLLEYAAVMINDQEASAIVALKVNEKGAVCFVLDNESAEGIKLEGISQLDL